MGREGVLAALKRAAKDIDFYAQLDQDYVTALKDYDVSPEEAMRIGTGDVGWIESHIGAKLDEEVMTKVMIPLLSREDYRFERGNLGSAEVNP